MAVYVDQPNKLSHGKYSGWCHMMADTEEELHELALSIGINRNWHQGDHYDLAPSMRMRAVLNGAKEVSSEFLVQLRKSKR